MEKEQYNDLVKDEKTPRPENSCEGLKIVKTNQLVWDIIPTFSLTCDKKMQNIEKTLVKAATILTKVVDKMAKLDTDENSEVLDNCNDTIALLGYANRQINLARRDFMKPDLDTNYVHLCAQSVPYTSYLFGDDVSKAAKDIEDTRKIGSRLGGYRGRPFYRGGRGRGFRRGFPEFSGVVEVATVVALHTDQEIDLMIPQKTSGEVLPPAEVRSIRVRR
jgi:hypothetical protein